jgi:hypothetical protein
MSETSNAPVIESLDLDIDLTKADLDFPLFPAGLVKARIIGLVLQPNKKETGRNMIVTFANETPLTSVKGRDFEVGKVKFKKWYPLQPSEKNPDWDWTAPIAELQLAALGERTNGLNTAALGGKVVVLKIKIEKETDASGKPVEGGREQNSIDKVLADTN